MTAKEAEPMDGERTRISFDIGGVISKYPAELRPLVLALLESPRVDVFVLSDMKPHAKAVAYCHDNGFMVPPERIVCCDYEKYGEGCKAVELARLNVHVHLDDFPGYLAEGCPVRLLVMPDPRRPYFDDSWKTDGSEGDFGRRRPAPAPARDWRVGLTVKARLRSNEMHYEPCEVLDVLPSGAGGIVDPAGVLKLKSPAGRVFLNPAGEWVTA
jgi:hypothetical protein